jgi:hypothetical protein
LRRNTRRFPQRKISSRTICHSAPANNRSIARER